MRKALSVENTGWPVVAVHQLRPFDVAEDGFDLDIFENGA
jgi:hypothetical protein